jgi:GH18 family chitinase
MRRRLAPGIGPTAVALIRVPAGQPVPPGFTATRTIDAWVARGAPRSELVLGLPFYGRGWTGVTGGDGLFQPADGALVDAIHRGLGGGR